MARKNYTAIDELMQKYKSAKANGRIGAGSKESEPIIARQESVPEQIQEAVEHKPEQEISTYVMPRAETIEIPPDLKRFGLQPATTTQFPTYQNVKLPLSDDKIVIGLHAPITSSLRWLATLAVYLLQQAHLGLKVIHGKIVRVIRN